MHLPHNSVLQPHLVSYWHQAALYNGWQCSPAYLPLVAFLNPSPVSRTLWLWLTHCWLTLYAACLIGSKVGMLKEGCFSWMGGFLRLLLSCKGIELCIINTFNCTGFVVHYDHKLLQHLQVPIFNLWWVLAGFLEDNRGLWKHVLCLPCRLYPFTRKSEGWHHITASESMEEEQPLVFSGSIVGVEELIHLDWSDGR